MRPYRYRDFTPSELIVVGLFFIGGTILSLVFAIVYVGTLLFGGL